MKPPTSRMPTIIAAALAGAAVATAAAWLLRPATPAAPMPAALHLAVPGLDPASASNGVLLSPDGRFLVTRGAAGVSVLHSFDGSPSRALEGVAQCWSPDSSSLVVRHGGELARMQIVRRCLSAEVAIRIVSDTA